MAEYGKARQVGEEGKLGEDGAKAGHEEEVDSSVVRNPEGVDFLG